MEIIDPNGKVSSIVTSSSKEFLFEVSVTGEYRISIKNLDTDVAVGFGGIF